MASKTVTRSIDDILIYCRWYWWIYEPMAPEIAEEMNSFCRFCSIKQEFVIFEHQSRKSLHGSYYYTWENRCFFSSLRFYFLSLAMGWCPWQPVTTSVTRVYGNCATLFSTKESFWCFYIAFKDIKYTLKLDSLLLTTILSFPCQYFETWKWKTGMSPQIDRWLSLISAHDPDFSHLFTKKPHAFFSYQHRIFPFLHVRETQWSVSFTKYAY